jgi:hypothetical protein
LVWFGGRGTRQGVGRVFLAIGSILSHLNQEAAQLTVIVSMRGLWTCEVILSGRRKMTMWFMFAASSSMKTNLNSSTCSP